MPTHIPLHLSWFTCEARSFFNGFVLPGPVSRTIQDPPRAQSPFARRGLTPVRMTPGHVRERYLSFVAPTGSCARPSPSRCLRIFLVQRVLAGCCQSLLGKGPSRRYLCNPCPGAWTHTPGRLSGASIRFFPESSSLATSLQSSARPALIASNFRDVIISRRQSFRYVQAPWLASPPGCSYRAGSRRCGQPGRLRHAMDWESPPRTVVSLHDRIGQLSWRGFHPLDCSLVGRYRRVEVRRAQN